MAAMRGTRASRTSFHGGGIREWASVNATRRHCRSSRHKAESVTGRVRAVEYPCAVSEMVRTPQVVIDDAEIFAAHEGGKLSVETEGAARYAAGPVDRLHARGRPGEPRDRRRSTPSPPSTPGPTGWSSWSATAPPCSASVTSARRASLPVMEGKSALFKTFAGLDSIPIVLDTKDPDEIVETLIRLRPTFGAVNLEDISAPRCFEIERRVIEALDCPVMHDDQHGTAIVVLAALQGRGQGAQDRDMHVAAGRHLRCRRGRCRVREHPARRRASPMSPCSTRRASSHAGRNDLNPFKAELAAAHQPARPDRWHRPRRSPVPMCSSGCPRAPCPRS